MKHNFKTYLLGDILINRKEVPENASIVKGEIPIISKIGFSNADIELRNDGVSNTKLISVYPNDLIISGINVEKGAIAINKCDKIIAATIHYSSYYPIKDKVELQYLWYFLRSSEFKFYLKQSFPSGIKTEIKPDKFLSVKIPLPPLAEQKRIVEKIESIQNRVEQIRKLRAEQEKEINNLKYSVFEKLFSEYGSTNIGALIEENLDTVLVNPTQQYLFAGIYGFGNGLFVRGLQNGNDTTYKTFNRLHENQLVMSQPKGWEGAIALVSKEFENLFLSPVYSTFIAKGNNNIKFVSEFCKLPTTWQKMLDVSKGIGARRNSIYAKDFLKIEIPNVSISDQNRIVSFLEKINQIRQTFKAQEAELTDLLPALLDKAFKGELFKEEKETLKVVRFNNWLTNKQENDKIYSISEMAILAGYIILKNRGKDFGRVKLMKLLFLIEYHCKLAISKTENQFLYQNAAGPYNEDYIKEIESILFRYRFFNINKGKTKSGNDIIKYEPQGSAAVLINLFQENFSAKQVEIEGFLDLFSKSSWQTCEIVATLYAVWNNRIKANQQITDEYLVTDFYDWSEHKAVYTKAQVENSLKWMREKEIVPDGWGEVIEKVKKRN